MRISDFERRYCMDLAVLGEAVESHLMFFLETVIKSHNKSTIGCLHHYSQNIILPSGICKRHYFRSLL